MARMEPNSVSSIVTDPPYGLSFMGKEWDHGVPGEPFWADALRVAKPGAHLLAFGGTRKYHRLTCAIEDAGWEIRDCIMWVYGSGFPKSHNIHKATGSDEWQGWGTALKPAWEPIIVARKPLDGTVANNVLTHGVGGLNVDGGRVARNEFDVSGWSKSGSVESANIAMSGKNYTRIAKPDNAYGRFPANLIHDGSEEVLSLFPGEGDKSPARFFYCAKASKADRGEGNNHPTVKPHDLMRYLVRLVTPPGGTVFDPFSGSGSTWIASHAEGLDFVGCELNAEYVEMATARFENFTGVAQ